MDTDFTELIQCLKKENADLHEKYTELYQDYIVCLEQNKSYKEQLNKLAPSPYTATINKLKTTFSPSPPGYHHHRHHKFFHLVFLYHQCYQYIMKKWSHSTQIDLAIMYSSVSIESADSLTPDGDDDKNYLTLSPEIKPVKEPTIDTKSTTEKKLRQVYVSIGKNIRNTKNGKKMKQLTK